MVMEQHSVVVGVFADQAQARQAIEELRRVGFSDDEIGFLTRAVTTESSKDERADVTTGAASGGVIGGVLGAAASLLIPGFGPAVAGGILIATLGGVVLGAAAGGIYTALVSLGVPERDASFYQQELKAGRTIVTVKSDGGEKQALAILRRYGAYNATRQSGIVNPPQSLRP